MHHARHAILATAAAAALATCLWRCAPPPAAAREPVAEPLRPADRAGFG